ncbi:MAG: hypothetical protein V4684_02610 [Pseudomonadota bacterium]
MDSRQIGEAPSKTTSRRSSAIDYDVSNELELSHRPGTVAILDDEPLFVAMLKEMLERSSGVEPFENAHRCLAFLQQDSARWNADFAAQQRVVNDWRSGAALIPSILKYWVSSPTARRTLTKVLIIDDHMPGMDGLELLTGLSDWHGTRLLLLTNEFDEGSIRLALDNGVIDKYVVKKSWDFPKEIRSGVRDLYAREDARCRLLWSATLHPEQVELLARPDVASELAQKLKHDFEEWFVLGRPFGVIGLDYTGKSCWLPLSTRASLAEQAEAAIKTGMNSQAAAEISSGKKLAAVELEQLIGKQALTLIDTWAPGRTGDLIVATSHIDLSLVAVSASSGVPCE